MPVDIDVAERADGTILLRSNLTLPDSDSNLPRLLAARAALEGEKTALAIRNATGEWEHLSYAQLKQSWGGYAGYDQWVADANNAGFGAQAAYDEMVPAFEALFERGGRSWPAFYDAVRRLADMPRAERTQALRQITVTLEKHSG